jgi:catechol 2,3-dioxygenase-like lactoylglutathione lyase family enzyme
MMEAVLARFERVSHIGLLTDDEPRQHEFYTAMGFRNIDSFEKEKLNAYVVFRS